MESKYLVFKELPPKPKTKVFAVHSKSNDDCLGFIRWYGSWRQYCFFSVDTYETIWNKDCLADLIKFIEYLKSEKNESIR